MSDKNPSAICIFSLKGGVGKTTLAHALATSLLKEGRRVAFLDADYSNPVAHLLFEIPHQRHKPLADYGIAPISQNGMQFASVAFLFSATGVSRQPSSHRAQVLADMCATIRWEPYEYLIIDMAPSSTEENRTILTTLDPAVVIVAERGPLAQRGLERSIKFLKAARAQVLGIVGNRGFDARDLAQDFKVPYLTTVSFSENPQVDPSIFLKAPPQRLGRVSLKQRGKRGLLRAGLETYVKVREWRR